MDLGPKKVLIEEHKNKLAILVVIKENPFYREKLKELIYYFEKIFELQQQINQTTHVCVEDYALTHDLVSLVFSEQSVKILEVIPLIFKSIQQTKSRSSKSKYFSQPQNTNQKVQTRMNEKQNKKIKPLHRMSK
jgi:hypothetical protein